MLALAFLAVTGALLIADLKHPMRFGLIFTRHHWRSWVVRGASGYRECLPPVRVIPWGVF